MSSSISSPSWAKCSFLFLIICTNCGIFSCGKLCNPTPNLCFSSIFISLLFGSLALGLGCFPIVGTLAADTGFEGGALTGEGVDNGDCCRAGGLGGGTGKEGVDALE
ncbi:hypothetical protein H5410_010562 [Solanum commersonii]|uniref:Uncharacterized protein n=1 Tax=Solanum commersonii TaxID=4109 RepID=A0A9J6AL23_SOLCO|nr:hypothetical protein H5410_010562 [Solanum commersonii]